MSVAGDVPERAPRRWFADWRVWLGIGITAASLGYAARGVPFDEVAEAFGRANVGLLLLLSVPAHIAGVYVRALRWRHLTDAIAPMSRGLLYRAESIGFLVNNLVPLRMGELVRAWYLARESRTSGAAVLGTIFLERILDVVCVVAMAGTLAALFGSSAGNGLVAQGARLLLPAAFLPLLLVAALRFAPDRLLAVLRFVARPLPEQVGGALTSLFERFTEGLGALKGGSHLAWIGLHSLVIWGVLGVIPMTAGILAFDIEVGSPGRLMMASWALLIGVGVAVAIPSAPGFFGTYQLAFVAILEPLGVDRPTCLALGLLVWFVFWCSFTFQGLLVVRLGGTSLAELTAGAGKAPDHDRR